MAKKDKTETTTQSDMEVAEALKNSIETVHSAVNPGHTFRQIDPKKLPMYNPDAGVSSNSSQLIFPTDKWGLTRDIKKAMILAASRIAGHPDKKELFDEILSVLLKHVDAKHADALKRKDVDYAASRNKVEQPT